MMSQLAALRKAIVEARVDLQAALDGAHTNWDKKPAASGTEETWSPKQVAEHAIASDLVLASSITKALGKATDDGGNLSCPTPTAASEELRRYAARSDRLLDSVEESELGKTYQGRTRSRTVAEGLDLMASHLREHAEQIREASR